uniref:Uncharacterized protein n=1 Tax=Arundo donax TaxID=35708 RepID=A0A0A9FJR2_ARUDO
MMGITRNAKYKYTLHI